MKSKILLKLIGIFIFGFITFTSCGSDSDDDSPDMSSILDKWWYSTDENIIDDFNFLSIYDIYFDSNGEVVRERSDTGELAPPLTWIWEDKNKGIMEVYKDIGDSHWFKFSDIEDHTMTVQESLDGSIYLVKVYFQDTEN